MAGKEHSQQEEINLNLHSSTHDAREWVNCLTIDDVLLLVLKKK